MKLVIFKILTLNIRGDLVTAVEKYEKFPAKHLRQIRFCSFFCFITNVF